MLKNRIIRSATHEGLADVNGYPTETLKKLYRRLASGGVGAIITGYAGIQQNGKSAHLNMLMIDKDEHINKYKEITDAVHEYGTPIILQIAHCGKSTRSKVTGEKTVAPSAFPDKMFNEEIDERYKDKAIAKKSLHKALENITINGFIENEKLIDSVFLPLINYTSTSLP
jgi:2,4-dienoyl-CoA reductase-like NADH-dependent reductase (Old Yellow Enzyme family)